jgi:hypothetical protein
MFQSFVMLFLIIPCVVALIYHLIRIILFKGTYRSTYGQIFDQHAAYLPRRRDHHPEELLNVEYFLC